MLPPEHRLVFVAGLHRSGTTPLARCIAAHPDVSGLEAPAAKENEGQHVQTVYPRARMHGGAGRFAFADEAHLTEESPLATSANAERLLSEWRPYWDLDKPVLLEKSPPNLLMTRFLQALYPQAYFVVVLRHPVVVSLSTRKWTRGTSLSSLVEHWFHAHDVFSGDAPHLERVHVAKYEDLVAAPHAVLGGIAQFLGLAGEIPVGGFERHRSARYEDEWRDGYERSGWPWRRMTYRRLCLRYEPRAQEYGYSMRDLRSSTAFRNPTLAQLSRTG